MPKVKKAQTASPQEIPKTGLLRLPQVLMVIPVSASTWWSGIKKGIFPKPVKLSARVTCWQAEKVWALTEGGLADE
jgi:predicted DNA-binding transcriptional regulator AlpA